MAFFQKTILKKYQAMLPKNLLTEAWQKYQEYFLNTEIQDNIRHSKEEQFQEGFLRELFVKVLGYTLNPSPGYNLITEQKNETDAKKADGAIWLNDKVVGVIELKDHKTTDLKKVEPQAFQYKSQNKEARYVIISNFEKLRLYIDNATEHREWNLFAMTDADFEELYCALAWTQIEKGIAIQMKEASVSVEKDVTSTLYRDYSLFKRELFENILNNNPAKDMEEKEWQLLLFKKTQKLLDRLLFVFFAEDGGLLPPNSMVQILSQWQQIKDLDEDIPLYNRIKKYFGYLDKGNPKQNIFAYNGGLFRADEVLDELTISDELLYKHTKKLSEYDFKSDIDVNILGHIFEHSLSEIEEVTQRIMGVEIDSSKSKRKKDGVFYTPPYITKYIIENTLGKLCAEKKQELDIKEDEYFSDRKRQKQTKIQLLDRLKTYREWLLQLTILDPACGSGAFLNAALSFLMDEHRLIDEMEAKVTGSAIVFQDIENSILENNLYGVDINEESVEIAQLALWLRTAKPQRKLSSLNRNIKCGNSLISDPAIAGDKAFDWEKEFPQVFERGGFDVVVGNPPYVDIKQIDKVQVDYLFSQYATTENRINLYAIFIEKGYRITKDGGYLSYINPNSMLINSSYTKLRRLLVEDIYDIVKLPDNVFEDAKVETIIFAVRKKEKSVKVTATVFPNNSFITEIPITAAKSFEKTEWITQSDCTFNIYVNNDIITLLHKIEGKHEKLGSVADFSLGITPYDKYKGHTEVLIKNREFHSSVMSDNSCKPLIAGENIVRYYVSNEVKEYIKYGDWLGAPREERFFIEPRIIVRQIVSGNPLRIYAGYTDEPLYFTQIGFAIIPKAGFHIKYILALLNSSLLNFYHRYRYLDLEKNLFQKILIANCKNFPVPRESKEMETNFAVVVDNILVYNKQLQEKRNRFLRRLKDNFQEIKITGVLSTFDQLEFADFLKELRKQKIALKLSQQDEWEDYFNNYRSACRQLSEQIAEADKEIDLRVYKLYGLTYDEVLIVDAEFGVSREAYNKLNED
ncbi:MAG: N-6 DNA methylase [Bacteroides sp.]|nr:N-6 DNA methylase [Bacteroides sp.]